MKTFKQFIEEANMGHSKGRQINYKKMDDLGDNPENYEELDLGVNPHHLAAAGNNITTKRIKRSNPSVVDDVLNKAQISRLRADLHGNAKKYAHHIGPQVQGY
jgi:hypothetical protein